MHYRAVSIFLLITPMLYGAEMPNPSLRSRVQSFCTTVLEGSLMSIVIIAAIASTVGPQCYDVTIAHTPYVYPDWENNVMREQVSPETVIRTIDETMLQDVMAFATTVCPSPLHVISTTYYPPKIDKIFKQCPSKDYDSIIEATQKSCEEHRENIHHFGTKPFPNSTIDLKQKLRAKIAQQKAERTTKKKKNLFGLPF
jgi:hypothetical protein